MVLGREALISTSIYSIVELSGVLLSQYVMKGVQASSYKRNKFWNVMCSTKFSPHTHANFVNM